MYNAIQCKGWRRLFRFFSKESPDLRHTPSISTSQLSDDLKRSLGIEKHSSEPEDQPAGLTIEAIPLLKQIKGTEAYKDRVYGLAEDLYDQLLKNERVQEVANSGEPVEVNEKERTALPSFTQKGKRDTIKALAHLVHSLANVASHPTQRQDQYSRRLRYVSVSLGELPYRNGEDYHHLRFTAMKRAIYGLQVLGQDTVELIDIKPGRYNRETGKGLWTRISATKDLKDRMIACGLIFANHPNPKAKKASGPLLRLRADDGVVVPLERPLSASEEILPDLNKRLRRQALSIKWPDYAAYEGCWDFDQHRSNASTGGGKTLYRQFVGSDGLGGRLYGHCVQRMPASARRHLVINGLPTAEADYSSMQLCLLYGLEGRKLPSGDLYANCGYTRDLMKETLTRSVGCSTKQETLQAIGGFLRESHQTTLNAEKLYHALWDAHPGLCPHDRPDDPLAWPRLQYAESELTLKVLGLLLEEDISAIPIHDSFIVQERHKDALRVAMEDGWKSWFPDTAINIKWKQDVDV